MAYGREFTVSEREFIMAGEGGVSAGSQDRKLRAHIFICIQETESEPEVAKSVSPQNPPQVLCFLHQAVKS